MTGDDSLPIIWSYGGGTQSVAIAVLVSKGELPRPGRVVIADTGREAQETWDYTRDVVNPLLSKVGLEVEVASHDYATVDLYGLNGDLLIPAYTGDSGALPGFCSKKEIQSNDERDGRLFLHNTRVPLEDAQLDHDNLDLFDGCDSGFCMV